MLRNKIQSQLRWYKTMKYQFDARKWCECSWDSIYLGNYRHAQGTTLHRSLKEGSQPGFVQKSLCPDWESQWQLS